MHPHHPCILIIPATSSLQLHLQFHHSCSIILPAALSSLQHPQPCNIIIPAPPLSLQHLPCILIIPASSLSMQLRSHILIIAVTSSLQHLHPDSCSIQTGSVPPQCMDPTCHISLLPLPLGQTGGFLGLSWDQAGPGALGWALSCACSSSQPSPHHQLLMKHPAQPDLGSWDAPVATAWSKGRT